MQGGALTPRRAAPERVFPRCALSCPCGVLCCRAGPGQGAPTLACAACAPSVVPLLALALLPTLCHCTRNAAASPPPLRRRFPHTPLSLSTPGVVPPVITPFACASLLPPISPTHPAHPPALHVAGPPRAPPPPFTTPSPSCRFHLCSPHPDAHALTPPPPPLPAQMDPKFLRNLRFSKKWNGKGRSSEE